jgi:hypothetical protein
MNSQLQDQILTDISKQMSKDIDFDIFASVLCKEGWTRVEIPRFIDNYHAVDIGYWLLDNCQGEYKRNGRVFLFESTKDATMFILRWGS